MTITQIARRVRDTHSACLIRYRSGEMGEAKEYDTRDLFGGNRRGWTVIDSMTAGAICAVYDGAREDLRPKLDTIPLRTLIDFCWRMVA